MLFHTDLKCPPVIAVACHPQVPRCKPLISTLCWFSTSYDWNGEPCLNNGHFCIARLRRLSGSSFLPNPAKLCPYTQTGRKLKCCIKFKKQKYIKWIPRLWYRQERCSEISQFHRLAVLFRQGRLWENISSVWCFWSSTRPPYFRKPSKSSEPSSHTSWKLDTCTLYLQAYTHTHKHRNTHTHPNMKIQQQQKKNSNNKPAGSSFFPSCLLSLSLSFSVYKTNLQVLFTNQPFFTALFTG